MHKDEEKKLLTSERVKSIVILVVSLFSGVNALLTLLGWNPLPFTNEEVAQGTAILIWIVATVWAWWRNNNVTTKAVTEAMTLKNIEKEQCEPVPVERKKMVDPKKVDEMTASEVQELLKDWEQNNE